jgi:predicted esterase YcpF (UPF0227 family)
MELVAQGVAGWAGEAMAVVGSSLGGFYASWVAQHKGCRSVLLNPAAHPARDLERYIGEQTAWHDPAERFYFEPGYIAELRALDVSGRPPAAPELAIVAKGDEVLDWREMAARYASSRLILLEGGEHALLNFEEYLPTIGEFLALA